MIAFQHDSLTVFQSALFQTNSTVIESRECVLVVDPTWLPSEVDEIARSVFSHLAGRPVVLLFTHSDFDHILGYGAFPEARVIASRKFAESPYKEQCVQKIHAWDSEYYIRRPYDIRYPEVNIVIDHDGQALTFGEMRLTFYKAPGHNPDGLLTVVEPQGILIAGDYLSDLEFPYIDQSSTAYEQTLASVDRILADHTITLLIPGHGQVTTEQSEMQTRRQHSADYIHTLRRHLRAGDQAALDAMLDTTAFPLGMKAFHEANQTLVRQELLASA